MTNNLPDRIVRFRVAIGYSQTELAEKVGMQPAQICHYEKGRRRPSPANLVKLAKALEIDLELLIGGSLAEYVGAEVKGKRK